jgi:hypothetical protein
VRSIAAGEVAGRAARETVIFGRAHRALDPAILNVEQHELARGRCLVPARLAVHDERPLDVHAGQRAGHEFGRVEAPGTDQLPGRHRRVGQRPEHVENGAHAHRAPDRHDGLHRRVIGRREQEREIGCLEAGDCLRLVQRQRHAEAFEQVGAARLRRHRAVAVFDDAHAAGRGQQAGAGRQVETAGTVAAGADGIDRRRAVRYLRVHGQLAHRPCESAQLVGRLAFRPQSRQERARKRGIQFPRREAAHQIVGVVLGQRLAVQQPVEERAQARPAVGRIHDAVIRMKFAIRRSPSGVSTLSGWNCTPSSGSVLWRTPMISPRSVCAVSSSTSGSVSGSAQSEW